MQTAMTTSMSQGNRRNKNNRKQKDYYVDKRGNIQKPKTDVKRVAKIAQSVVLKNQEHKYFDSQHALTLSSTAILTSITQVPQGDGDTTRDGDKLLYTRLYWNLQFILATAGYDYAVVRMIIFQWKVDDTINLPVTTSILAYNAYNSPYNHDQGARYRVFYDRTFTLCEQGEPNKVLVEKCNFVKKTGSCKYISREMKYTNAAVTGFNSLYVLYITDSVNNVGVNGYFRLNFTDS